MKRGIITRAMPVKGRLIQKIQRWVDSQCTEGWIQHEAVPTHVTSSENAPPTSGPETEPMAYMPLMIPKYCPLSLNGMRSQMMSWVSTMMPPPPIP